MTHDIFELNDFVLQSGQTIPDARLAYKTYGSLNKERDNVVLLPTFYTGTHVRNEGFFGNGRAIDPARHFIVSVNLFGNGLSSSPSNTPPPPGAACFPTTTLWDNVHAQHLLLKDAFEIDSIKLVAGWSMAGCQAYQWAAQYPDFVESIVPFCASARTSPHNFVFLEGVKAALTADQVFAGGNYREQPVAGLKAFARVYAGWAFSQTFYREHMYRQLGFANIEELLVDWENDHVENWDANDLLHKLKTWQLGDISANEKYGSDFNKALGAITARAILIPCSDDLYFPPEDNELESKVMPNAEFRPYESAWGHCVASPGNDPEFHQFLDRCFHELLD